MKKGFTLIELLAVIVILAIIALIATPIVLDIINDAKKSATLRSAEFYLKGVETSISTAILKNKINKDDIFEIRDGDICLNDDCTEKLEVDVDGEVPKKGTIIITKGTISGLNIMLEEKEIQQNSKGELVYVKTLEEVCKLKSGIKKTEGAKYECKVDPSKDPYTFYVLNTRNAKGEIITELSTDKKAVSINLIMAQNINSNGSPTTKSIAENQKDTNNGIYNKVAWISKEDYNDDVNYEVEGNNDKGPLTAMNFLSEATKNWTNTNRMIINSFDNDDSTSTPSNMKIYNIYARMPYYNEVNPIISKDKIWLIDYLDGAEDEAKGIKGRENRVDGLYGYWTLSASSTTYFKACRVNYLGEVDTSSSVYRNIANGVRPVINLKL